MKIRLGHGASGGPETMAPYVEGLRRRGFAAEAVRLPRGSAERALPAFLEQSGSGPGVIVGGHSFGARVAAMLAAAHPVAAVVCFSYPLHPPGRPEQLRTDFWSRIDAPVLIVNGDRDPFSSAGLEKPVAALRQGRLVILPGARHGFRGGHLEAALDVAAEFLSTVLC